MRNAERESPDPGRRPNCKPTNCMRSRSTLNIHIDRKQWVCDAASCLSALHAWYGAITALTQQDSWPMLFLYCYLMRKKMLTSKIPSSFHFSGCESWHRDFNLFFFFSPFGEPSWEFLQLHWSRWIQTVGWDEYENYLTLRKARTINKNPPCNPQRSDGSLLPDYLCFQVKSRKW